MFPREAYLIYNEIQSKTRAKGQVSGVSMIYTNKSAALQNSPKDQCKGMIHESLFLELDAICISYDSTFCNNVLCNSEANNDC